MKRVNRISSTRMLCATSSRLTRASPRGFSLVEVMVVLAIAALVTGLTFSGFTSLTNGNRRTTCQTNLSQIYSSLRLYQADEGSFPYYNDSPTPMLDENRFGLWALYTFPDYSNVSNNFLPIVGTKPIDRYLRNPKVLHCPAHVVYDYDGDGTLQASEKPENLLDGDTYNSAYLSYQVADPTDNTQQTYQPVRTTNAGDAAWKRQLLYFNGINRVARPPAENTVVTWCPWHRGSGRDYDNVLFYDGSVQLIPRQQDGAEFWQRTLKDPQ